MRTAFERDGDIRSVDLAAAFASLWRERATGVLTFSQPEQSVRFDILGGVVVGVVTTDPAFETGEVLVRAGKLDPSALEGRRSKSLAERARAAREQGLVTERDWRWGEKIRAVEILADLLTWLEGRYSFDPEGTPEGGELRLGIERLLLELFLRSRDREFIHQSLGATDAPLQRAEDFDEAFPALGLTSDALAVVSAIDGRATAAEICRRVPPDPFSVQKLLAALTTLGLVHPEYAVEAKPRKARLPAPPPTPPPPEPEPESAPPDRGEPAAPPEPPRPKRGPAPMDEPADREIEASRPTPEPEIARTPPEELPLELSAEPTIEPPLDLVPEPSEPEPAVTSWDHGPPDPLDQRLDLPEPPDFDRSSRPGRTPVWVLGGLAVAVAALLFLRSRRVDLPGPIAPPAAATALPAEPTTAPAVAPRGRATPTARAEPSPTVSPTAVPTEIPPTPTAPRERPPTAAAPPAAVAAILRPTPRPAIRSTPAPRAGARGVPADRQGWLEWAGRDRRELASDPRTLYTIQLELVCELPSLEEAWVYDRGGRMWLLVAPHRGRECFRVFWGRYATLGQARAAKASVPRFFFTPTNQPTVVSTRTLLP